MTDQEKFEKIKEACLSQGGKLLLEHVKEHKAAADTIKVYPVTSEEMMARFGYVQALDWVTGLIQQYQELTVEDLEQDQEE